MKTNLACFWLSYPVLVSTILIVRPAWALLPFPYSVNQRGTVTCLENPYHTYDIYLPPAYTTNGPALPILYTMNPNDGGMVSQFQAVCSSLYIIAVGITGPRNGVGWDRVLRKMDAVTRDVRVRVLYDPTAEFAGGFSGVGLFSNMFSRLRSQHAAGVLEMAGWLGRGNTGASVRKASSLPHPRGTTSALSSGQ